MNAKIVLFQQAIQDIQAGRGVAVIDPHGDLVEKMLDFVPSDRINDIIYFNPADVNHPIAFNPLDLYSYLDFNVKQSLIQVIK